MKAIVAVDQNWGIGYNGNLLERIPEDMKNFKRTTVGKVVVMGRETFQSLPGRQPLKDRINIVLSRSGFLDQAGVIICRSLEDLFRTIEKYNSEDVFVIGGESVYIQLLPYCTEVYVTKIGKEHTADKFFINLDQAEEWKLETAGNPKTFNNFNYSFLTYKNLKSLPEPEQTNSRMLDKACKFSAKDV